MVQTTMYAQPINLPPEESLYVLNLKEYHVESEERWLGLNLLPATEESWFEIEEVPINVRARELDVVTNGKPFFKFRIFLSPDKQMYKRSIYTFLDWVGDVGGLLDGLKLVGAMLMTFRSMILGNPFSSFLLSSLYKKDTTDTKKLEGEEAIIESINRRTRFVVPFCCCNCLRRRKEKKVLTHGIEQTLKELEVDRFIKTQKQVRVIVSTLFSKVERFLIRNNRAFVLNSSCCEDSNSSNSGSFNMSQDKDEKKYHNFMKLLRGSQKQYKQKSNN